MERVDLKKGGKLLPAAGQVMSRNHLGQGGAVVDGDRDLQDTVALACARIGWTYEDSPECSKTTLRVEPAEPSCHFVPTTSSPVLSSRTS